MKSKYIRAMGRGKSLILLTVSLCMILLPGIGFALPTSGTVVSGGGTVTQTGSTMNINQATSNLIMNWHQFNIGAGERVIFLQPSVNAVSLNRVLGSDPSQIFGQLSANGKVFLINPNGVLFASNAHVDVGGLVATTMNISDQDFLSGNYRFKQDSTIGSVINQGIINAGNGGYVALFAPQVRNEGVLVAQLGTVALGAGKQVTLDVNRDGLLHLSVDQAVVNANIANKGLIRVEGGQAILSAKAGDALLATVINNEGIIEAKSTVNRNGVICLEGDSGVVAVSGVLDVSGKLAGQTGGTIKVLGQKVGLFDHAKLDASGYAGGGTILIGGNYQGKGSEQNAQRTFVGTNAMIHADALVTGNGGKVVVWADDTTRFQGRITAGGGIMSGNGGSVEVSGKKVLNFQGDVDLHATAGRAGTLLLDPKNIVIDSAGADVVDAASHEVAFADNSGNTTTINGSNLASAISLGNVILQADNDITFNDSVNVLANNNNLSLQAGRSIVFNGISALTTNGNVTAIINDENANAANRDSGIAKFKMYNGAQINTNGGTVTIGPKNNRDGYVEIGNNGAPGGAVIKSNGGNINIKGNGGTAQNVGIALINGSSIQNSGHGTITLTGTGGNGTSDNYGVYLNQNSIIRSTDGDITVNGIGGNGSASFNSGIVINTASVIESTGNGKITLAGAGGAGDQNNNGVFIMSGGVRSSQGDVTIVGSSNGIGLNNIGIRLDSDGFIQSTGGAELVLAGVGGNGVDRNNGITVRGGTIQSNGNITLTGAGGNAIGNANLGVSIEGGLVESTGDANIRLNGIGGNGAHYNYGVLIDGGSVASADGNIAVNGTGGGTLNSNGGIVLSNGGTIQSTGSGAISLHGIGGNGIDSNHGVYVTGSGSGITSKFGDVTITGQGKGTGDCNFGIEVSLGGFVESQENGKISLQGTGSNGLHSNHGVVLNNSEIKSVDGNVSINGTGGGNSSGGYNIGILLQNNSFESTGNSNLSLTGTGGQGSIHDYGIATEGGITSTNNNTVFNGAGTDGISSGIVSTGSSITAKNLKLQSGDVNGIELGVLNANGNLTLTADKMVLNSTMTGNDIIVQPSTAGKEVTLGGVGIGLNLTQADLNKLNTSTLQIGSSTTGTITVASPLAQGSRNVILQTGRDINLNAPVTNGELIIRGSNGNNNFNIGSGSLDGFASMRVEGIGGNDILNINDATSSHDNIYTITGTQIQYASIGATSGLTISYDGVNNLFCTAGVGRENQVNTQFIPGVTQTLSGGNAAVSVLNFDGHGTNPVVTSSTIAAPGYGTVTYSGFATVNLVNIVPTSPNLPGNLSEDKYTTAVYLGKRDKSKEILATENRESVVIIKNGGVRLPDNMDTNTSGVATGMEKE